MKDVAPPPNAQVPPLPADVAALLAAERVLPPAAGDLHARLLARVEASMALPPVTPAGPQPLSPPAVVAATTSSLGLGIAKVLAVVAVVAGAGWFAISDDTEPVARPTDTAPGAGSAAVVARQLPVLPPQTAPVAPTMPARVVSMPVAAQPDTVSEVPVKPSKPRPAVIPAPNETSIIALAREAAARRDWRSARIQLELHRRHYPRGLLAEERDLLLIRLAVATGRDSDAERLRARFVAAYPRSVHRHGLEIPHH